MHMNQSYTVDKYDKSKNIPRTTKSKNVQPLMYAFYFHFPPICTTFGVFTIASNLGII